MDQLFHAEGILEGNEISICAIWAPRFFVVLSITVKTLNQSRGPSMSITDKENVLHTYNEVPSIHKHEWILTYAAKWVELGMMILILKRSKMINSAWSISKAAFNEIVPLNLEKWFLEAGSIGAHLQLFWVMEAEWDKGKTLHALSTSFWSTVRYSKVWKTSAVRRQARQREEKRRERREDENGSASLANWKVLQCLCVETL